MSSLQRYNVRICYVFLAVRTVKEHLKSNKCSWTPERAALQYCENSGYVVHVCGKLQETVRKRVTYGADIQNWLSARNWEILLRLCTATPVRVTGWAILLYQNQNRRSRSNVFCMAIRCGLDGLGFESRQFFLLQKRPRRSEAHSTTYTRGTGFYVDNSSPLSTEVRNEQTINFFPSITSWRRQGHRNQNRRCRKYVTLQARHRQTVRTLCHNFEHLNV